MSERGSSLCGPQFIEQTFVRGSKSASAAGSAIVNTNGAAAGCTGLRFMAQNVVGRAMPRMTAMNPVCKSVAPMLTHR